MYSVSVRLNGIFFQTLFLVTLGCAINFLSAHYFMQPTASSSVEAEVKNMYIRVNMEV